MTDLQQRIRMVVLSVSQTPDASPAVEEPLFDSGVLDSFGLPDLVTALEKEFGVRVSDADLRPANFRSIAAIERYIQEHRV
jgi:acyl carrier protein